MLLTVFAHSFQARTFAFHKSTFSRSHFPTWTSKATWASTLVAIFPLLFTGMPAQAQSGPIMERGDAAVTSFSGATQESDVPAGAHPLDVTTIDLQSASVRVMDLSKLGGPPEGQIANATNKFSVPASDIGQVFGIALDSPDDGVAPSIFAAATSFYGLQIVGKRDGKTTRLVNGEPGATWMAGQFGTVKGGGPGTIWKIDGKTRAVSLFTSIMSGPNENSGAGLGALAYDSVTQQLYVPNLETGFIHRINKDGKDLGVFDHGTSGRAKVDFQAVAYDPTKRISIENPEFSIESPHTWGYADKRRLVIAVKVYNDRLYYSVADGPQVWSVGLDAAGGFIDNARLEFDVDGVHNDSLITGIAFSGPGEIYLTQRGKITGTYDYGKFASPDKSAVVHYSWDEQEQRWSDQSKEFPVGIKPAHRASNGGLALGYGYDDNGKIKTDICNATLWSTGDRLRDTDDGRAISGLQGISKSSGQARTERLPRSGTSALQGDFQLTELTDLTPPEESWFIDLDKSRKDDGAFGQIGALAIHAPYCGADDPSQSSRPEPIDVPEPQIAWPDLGPDGPFPDEPFPGGFPPIGMPGLEIKKSCAPAAFGGVITCTISVENTGTLPFFVPITVSDATTIAAGPGAGGAMQIKSVTPDGGEWTCTPTPSINLTCALKPEALLPGVKRSFDVDIDTSTMIADGNVGFKNCASLGAPYWGIACDNAGVDITVKKTANPGCVAGANCTYGLEITNNAPTPFNGQVQLSDEMFRGAAGPALNAPIVAINGDLGCPGGNPAAIPFSCNSTMTLAGGETRNFDMTVTMPAVPANYWARNCFAATTPGLVPGDLASAMPPGGGSLGTGGAVSCAWMQVGVPGPHANLKLKKTAKTCGKIPGDPNTVKCDYTISMTNTGPSDFNTPISFDETVDPAATLVLNEPGWACAGGPPTYACNSAGNVTIAANETIEIAASVTTPRDVVEANVCLVPNTVSLTAPVVNPATNYLGGDDTATADGDAFLLEFNLNGAAIILCDPTNLKTTQVAKGPCEKAGAGWDCKFGVEIENTGPDPYKGEITLLNVQSVSATPVSHSGTPGWSRSPFLGHQAYKLPQGTLEKGDSVTLDLTVNIPDGPDCSLTSTAHMSFPVLKRHNGDKTDDTALATATIPRPECRKSPQCTPKEGEFRTASGACACERNAKRNKDGSCDRSQPDPETPSQPEPDPEPEQPTASVCPDGYPIPRNGVCPCKRGEIWDKYTKTCVGDDYDPPIVDVIDPVVPLCKLLPGQIRTKGNRCVCPNGRSWNRITYCKPLPCRLLPGQIRTSNNKCVCENGRKWNSKTYCERARPSCKPRPGEVIIRGKCKCANGRTWNAKTYCDTPPREVCPNADTYQAAPGVCCLIGQVYRDGKCRRTYDPANDCKAKGWTWTGYECLPPAGDPAKDCKAKGWTWTGKRCVPPTSTCARPRFKNKLGICTCGANKVYNARTNTCDRKSDPAKECRNKGWNWNGYECVRPSDPAKDCKAKGWRWTGKRCVPPTSTCARPRFKNKLGICTCGANKVYNARKNTCDRKNNPAKDCKLKGWKWTGKRCIKPVSPATKCKLKGWKWTGKSCIKPVSPATKCKLKGWKWTGKSCIKPVSPATKCKLKGWKWTGKSCIKPVSPATKCKRKGWKWTGKKCVPPRKPCPKGTVGPGQPNCKYILLKKKPVKKKPTILHLPKKTNLGRRPR